MRVLFVSALLAVVVCHLVAAEKTLKEHRRLQRQFNEIEISGVFQRFRAAPNSWLKVSPMGVQSLFLSKVFILFSHEPACFETVVWKNVLAVGLKKKFQYADVLFVDRFENTGGDVVTMLMKSLPDRVMPENIHCIGVGYGASLCTLLGQLMQERHQQRIARITACDPLGKVDTELMFGRPEMQPPTDLDFIDVASFVDCIHTSFLGSKQLLGDVDVFVNSGIVQPECLPLKVATDVISFCQNNHLECPPMEELHSCAFNNNCPKGLLERLDDTIRHSQSYSSEEVEKTYTRDLYELFLASRERSALIFAASLQPYLNCPVCKPNLKTTMCECNEAVIAQDYKECPKDCETPQQFGIGIDTTITGTFQINTSGYWPYFTCISDEEAGIYYYSDSADYSKKHSHEGHDHEGHEGHEGQDPSPTY